MSETRSGERGPRTSRTAPRRRASGSAPGPATPRRTRRASSSASATATLDREPALDADLLAALPEADPTRTDAAAGDTARTTRRGGRSPRTERRERTPRHRLLLACTAVLTLGMLAVLVLNTVISQGAFRQHELEIKLILLAEKEESLSNRVDLAETPIEVEKKARALGMVPAGSPVFLRLSDGKILGDPVPAPAATGPVDFVDAPGIQPTPDPSASATASDGTAVVDPALDPATGLDADTTGAADASPSAGTSPSASPSGAAALTQAGASATPSPSGASASGPVTQGDDQ